MADRELQLLNGPLGIGEGRPGERHHQGQIVASLQRPLALLQAGGPLRQQGGGPVPWLGTLRPTLQRIQRDDALGAELGAGEPGDREVAGEGKAQGLLQARGGGAGCGDALGDVVRPHQIGEGQAIVEQIREIEQQGWIL